MPHKETDLSHFRKPLVKRAMVQIVSRPFPCSNSAGCYLQRPDNCSEAKHQPADTYRERTQSGSSSAQSLEITARDKGAHVKDGQTNIWARVRRMSEPTHTCSPNYYTHTRGLINHTFSGGSTGPKANVHCAIGPV